MTDLKQLKIGDRCRTRGEGILIVRDLRRDKNSFIVYWTVLREDKEVPLFWFYHDDGMVKDLTPHKHDILEIL